jgi:hypothetical protein
MSKPRPLTQLMPKATRNILGKKGMLFTKLISKWPDIVGPDLASKATPLELKFSKSKKQSNKVTLHLAISGAYAPEIQSQTPQLIERLNSFFGYNAIETIKLIHTTGKALGHKFATPDIPDLSKAEQQKINHKTEHIPSDPLKEALNALGRSIIARQKAE